MLSLISLLRTKKNVCLLLFERGINLDAIKAIFKQRNNSNVIHNHGMAEKIKYCENFNKIKSHSLFQQIFGQRRFILNKT